MKMSGADGGTVQDEPLEPSGLLAAGTLCQRELVRFFRQRNRVFGAMGQPIVFWILFGAGLGLVIHLAQTSAPRLTLLQQSGGRLTRVIGDERSDYLVLEVSGDLHYAAVPPFLTEAERLLADPGRGVVIDLSHAHQVRFGAIVALERLAEQMEERNSNLWLAGVQPDVAELVVRSGSPLNMMPAETEPGRSARKALIAMAEAKLRRG